MRIVSLAPSNTEIVSELGADKDLIATTSLCDHPERATDLPSVGGWTSGIDFDRIEALEPGLVLTSDSLQDEAVEELEQREIETLHVEPESLDEVFDSILAIGTALGKEEEAETLVGKMREEIGSVDLEGARIYCEEWMKPPMVSGNWIPDLIEKAGGEYLIEGGERSREVSDEEIAGFDPEYVFLNVCGAGENAETSEIMEREGWSKIEAVRNGEVYVVDDALLNRPSPRLIEGLQAISDHVS